MRLHAGWYSALILGAIMMVAGQFMPVPARAELVDGRDYVKLGTPQKTDTVGKVEVIEFFSWGCSACYAMHPHLTRWLKQLPSNAVLVRVPLAMGRAQWGVLSRTYYSLQFLGELERLDTPLFEAIHVRKQNLFDEQAITAWVAKQGVDAAKFTTAYNSFSVSSKALRAEEMARNYRVDSTPRIAVAGKYVVVGKGARSFDDVLAIASQLIAKAATET